MKKNFVFGVDLDGVVANFIEGLRPIAADWLGVDEGELAREVSYGFPEWHLERMGANAQDGYERLHRFAVTQRNLFCELPAVEGAPAALRRLSALGVRIRIISHRLSIQSFHRPVLEQTIDWLDHQGVPYWDLCFMKDRSSVGADLYIEDSPANIQALRAAGCDVICFGNSTNATIVPPRATNWLEVEGLVREWLERWEKGIAIVAKRAAE